MNSYDPTSGVHLSNADQYWATLPANELANVIRAKEHSYFSAAERRGLTRMWQLCFEYYYGMHSAEGSLGATQQIAFSGADSEVLVFRTNQVRSFLRQVLLMATRERPAFMGVATTTDSASITSTDAARQIAEFVYESSYGEVKERDCMELALLAGFASTWQQWDAEEGQDVTFSKRVTTQDGSVVEGPVDTQRSGAVVLRTLAPWEQFFEPSIRDRDEHVWSAAIEWRSKWELVNAFPEYADKLKSAPGSSYTAAKNWFDKSDRPDDSIRLVHFYHRKTGALKDGRYLIVAGDIVVKDSPIPYRRITIDVLMPTPIHGTGFGYSDFWDVLSKQQVLDEITSATADNVISYGRQCIAYDADSGIDLDALSMGKKFIPIGAGSRPPVAISLAPSPDGITQWVFSSIMGMIREDTALNDVARGRSTDNVKSGTHAALLHSVAMESNNDKLGALDRHREAVTNSALDIIRDFAEAPLIIEVVGESGQRAQRQMTSDALRAVPRVRVRTAPAIMRTLAGKMQVAEEILKLPGVVTTPEAVVEVFTSGRVEGLSKAPHASQARIAWENELLRDGAAVVETEEIGRGGTPEMVMVTPTVPVVFVDDHAKHWMEHKAELEDAIRAGDESAKKSILAHMTWHLRLFEQMTPSVAQLCRIQMPVSSALNPSNETAAPPAAQGSGPSGGDKFAKQQSAELGVQLPEPAKSPTEIAYE